MRKGHNWICEDDTLVCYLSLYGEDEDVTKHKIAEYLFSHSGLNKEPRDLYGPINMHKGNYNALQGKGKLDNASKLTRKVYAYWKDKSQEEHKAKCKEVLVLSVR